MRSNFSYRKHDYLIIEYVIVLIAGTSVCRFMIYYVTFLTHGNIFLNIKKAMTMINRKVAQRQSCKLKYREKKIIYLT